MNTFAPGRLSNFRWLHLSLVTIAMVSLTTGIQSTANADEKAGQKWAKAQRVSYGNIDHRAYHQLLQKYVDEEGLVNYKAWQASGNDRAALKKYLAQLGKADASKPATGSEKLAYWINAYNALTIEGILRVYPTSSIRNHTAKLFGYNIWKNLKLTSGDQEVNLDHIEHQILRKMGEPRIHFAIVCASIGCPRLMNEAYVANKIEEQLKTNTRDFFSRSQNLKFDRANKKLMLSSIVSWFGTDFGKTQIDQLKFIASYFPEDAKTFVAEGGYGIEFLDYDWNLNEQTLSR